MKNFDQTIKKRKVNLENEIPDENKFRTDKKVLEARKEIIRRYVFKSRLTINKINKTYKDEKLYKMIIEQNKYNFETMPFKYRAFTVKKFVRLIIKKIYINLFRI